MKKLEYFIKNIHPIVFFEDQNYNAVKVIKTNFPKLKIIPKGDRILAEGEDSLIDILKNRLDTLIILMNQNLKIDDESINSIMKGNGDKLINSFKKRTILFGNGKKEINAKTINQTMIVESFEKNDMVFAIGPRVFYHFFVKEYCLFGLVYL